MRTAPGRAAAVMAAILLWFMHGAAAQAPLTDAQVEGFLNSYPGIIAFADEHGDLLEPSNRRDRGQSQAFSDAIGALKSQGLYTEFAAVVRPHGFDSPEGFAGIADRIMRAFAARYMDQKRPQMNSQMEMARRAIIDNPNIPQAQKDEMLRRMEAAMGQSRRVSEASPADIAVVKRHAARIESAMRETSGTPERRAPR